MTYIYILWFQVLFEFVKQHRVLVMFLRIGFLQGGLFKENVPELSSLYKKNHENLAQTPCPDSATIESENVCLSFSSGSYPIIRKE